MNIELGEIKNEVLMVLGHQGVDESGGENGRS